MTFRFAGYSIIEMAIALVVLGLLLGAAAVPLRQRFEAEDRNETEEILEDATAAVVGFAVANRTVQRTVIGHDGVHYNLPSGRPYLPCPDISGDGVENRTTVTVALLATIDITSPVLVSEGVCDESKGLLPWRTLGLRGASDPWGRRIGYRVDIAYSSEVMGFDETFRADIFDPRLGVTLDANGVEFYQPRASRNEVGALVCTEIAKTVGCPVLAANMPNLVAGVVTTISINLGAREFPAYADINGADPVQGVLDGAVFVVYSHGKNGKGGISSQNDGPNNRCLDFQDDPGDLNNISEHANAFYGAGHPMLAAPFECADLSMRAPELAENLFFSGSPGTRGNMDDMLVWTSANSLVGALLRAGALPIPKLGFLPEER